VSTLPGAQAAAKLAHRLPLRGSEFGQIKLVRHRWGLALLLRKSIFNAAFDHLVPRVPRGLVKPRIVFDLRLASRGSLLQCRFIGIRRSDGYRRECRSADKDRSRKPPN
jgi:hypothetical protein